MVLDTRIFSLGLNESLNLHSHATACSAPLDTIPDTDAVDVTLGSADFTTLTIQPIKSF